MVFTLAGMAQKSSVPAATEKAFQQKFAGAANVKWDKENKNEYEAGFILNGKKGSANFSATGEWLETEMSIPVSSAPKAVLDGFAKAYKDATITELYQVESKTGKNYFEIEYTRKGKKKEAKLDANGHLI